MNGFKQKFERLEQKYFVTDAQREALMAELGGRFVPDEYGESRIFSLYYDTPDYRLIRRSLEKPIYKEKLRLRTYGAPGATSTAFAEIKKKYRGIVYKRRISMHYAEALRYLGREAAAPEPSQISREIDWMFSLYPGLRPAMLIACDRTAYFAREDPELRITFDRAVTGCPGCSAISADAGGTCLLPEGVCLMELKLPGAVPLWLAHALDELGIYPTSFSKYGEAYRRLICDAGITLPNSLKQEITSQNNKKSRKDPTYA